MVWSQRRQSRTVTLSPAYLALYPGSRWAQASCGSTKTQLTARKSLKVSAVLKKLAIHYYMPAQTEQCFKGYTSELTDLQPKHLLATLLNSVLKVKKKDSSKFNFNSHPATTLFISCIYCLYAITICSFILYLVFIVVTVVYRTLIFVQGNYQIWYLLRGNYHI